MSCVCVFLLGGGGEGGETSREEPHGMHRGRKSTAYTAQETPGSAVSAAYSSSRCSSVRTLLSSSPGKAASRGSTTAAATTGPARGPLPASSTPATDPKPRAHSADSAARVGPPRLPAANALRRLAPLAVAADLARFTGTGASSSLRHECGAVVLRRTERRRCAAGRSMCALLQRLKRAVDCAVACSMRSSTGKGRKIYEIAVTLLERP